MNEEQKMDKENVKNTEVKFISFDGKFPNLCAGKLTIEVAGVEFVLPSHTFESGGSVTFDDDWEATISEGPWKISDYAEFPEELKHFKGKILELVNENVEHGCCGGCV